MDYLQLYYRNSDKKRTQYYRLTESDTFRPRDRYDSVDRQPFTYRQQYTTQIMYYDTTDRYDNRHNTPRPVRQSDLTDRHEYGRHDRHRRPYQHRREEKRRHRDERGSCHSDESVSLHGDERGSGSRDTGDGRAGQAVTCTIPTPPVDDEWFVLDVWDQEDTIETIFYPELWSTHMTESDYAQMHQWEMETDSLKQTVTTNTVKDANPPDVVSRKRSLETGATPSMEPPVKQPRVHANKNHAGYARLMAHHSTCRNGGRF